MFSDIIGSYITYTQDLRHKIANLPKSFLNNSLVLVLVGLTPSCTGPPEGSTPTCDTSLDSVHRAEKVDTSINPLSQCSNRLLPTHKFP